MMVELIEMWHKRCRPAPSADDFNVQMGCHLEEIAEMFEVLTVRQGMVDASCPAWRHLLELADGLKSGEMSAVINKGERGAFLDSLADQVVTAIGVGHCAGMQTGEALRRVNTSNWSKFDDNGHPLRDDNGKIAKGPRYAPPDLGGLF
jgi:hypothetical protein